MIFTEKQQKNNKLRGDRKTQTEQNSNQNDNYLMYMRKKYKKSRDRRTTHSVCSIDAKKNSINSAYQPNIRKRRKLLSIPSIDAQNIYTERPLQEEVIHSRPIESAFEQAKSNRRIKTIEQIQLDIKQKKIKNCIEMMQGVLKQIQEQKSVSNPKKKKITYELLHKQPVVYPSSQYKKENQSSNFQKFIKKLPHSKQDSKPIILKKAKSRSIINLCNSSKEITNDKLKKHPKQIRQGLNISNIQLKSQVRSRQTLLENKGFDIKQRQKCEIIQSFDCSTIYNANQSSFISNNGKLELIKNLSNEKYEKQTIQINKKNIKISHRKLKNNFPFDFF